MGWPAGLALCALLCCGGFFVVTLQPLQTHILAIRREVHSFNVQSKRVLPVNPGSDLNPAQQLERFYRFFPEQDSIAEDMKKLYSAAATQNLNLETGEYHLTHEHDIKLARYSIVFPVKGGYVQIRKFIAQSLTDIPNLALDSITFTRERIDDPLLEAQLQFTLYLGEF
jgi:hypothetical protein